jgi:uncharacterized protein (DUF302 family)
MEHPMIKSFQFFQQAFVPRMLMDGAARAQPEVVRLQSAFSFSETVDRLKTALTDKGMTLFAVIDQRQAARSVGLEMPPTTVLVYGNPKVGTPLMLAAPEFALELPLRVVVLEDASARTWVLFNPANSLKGRHVLPAGMEERLSGAEKLLAAAIQVPG